MHRMHSPFHRLLVFASLLRVFASLFRVFASLLGVFASLLGVFASLLRVYGFEIFECFRKMALIALPVFAPADSPEQLVFGLIICFITFWNVHGECALSRANAHPVFPRSLVQSRPQLNSLLLWRTLLLLTILKVLRVSGRSAENRRNGISIIICLL